MSNERGAFVAVSKQFSKLKSPAINLKVIKRSVGVAMQFGIVSFAGKRAGDSMSIPYPFPASLFRTPYSEQRKTQTNGIAKVL